MRSKRLAARRDVLLICLIASTAASLFHYSHNAEFLNDYPNLPVWLSRAEVYAAWVAVTVIGFTGYSLFRRRYQVAGLLILAVYGLLGLDGLGHFAVASPSAHTMTMNFGIWLEVATALVLLTAVGRTLLTVTRQAS
jgi:hypothetical protein